MHHQRPGLNSQVTEPKDTLHYLVDKVRARLGNPDAVDVIHGCVSREERRKLIERFMPDRDMLVTRI